MVKSQEPARQSVDAGDASDTPSSPPVPAGAAKDPGEELAHLYAQRRAKAATTPPARDPRELLAELAAAQRTSGVQEPPTKDPRQRLGELAAQQRVKRARGQAGRHDSTTVPTAVSAATPPADAPARPPADAPPVDQPASRPLPGDEEELERLRADLDRQERRLADLERQLAERAAPEVQQSTIPTPNVAADEAAPAAGPSAPTLSARLRARKRELGELPPPALGQPAPSKPPPDDQSPAAVTPPIPVTDQPAPPPEQDSSKGPDGARYNGRRRWLLVLPILAVLILGLEAVALVRPHGPRAVPTASVAGPVPTIGPPTVTIAAPTASGAVQASPASIAATPVGAAPVAAVLTAEGVSIARSTATSLPAATPSPAPTTVPTTAPTTVPTAAPTTVPTAAPPTPAPTTAPAVALLSRAAKAEAALRSGRLTATIDDGTGTRATATLEFDFGSGTQPPRLHLTTTYVSPAGTQTSEQITIGDQAWQRQANGQWAPSTPLGAFDNVQPYLPRAASVTDATLAGDGSTLSWFNASRAVDVTLKVDAATGVPLTMQETPRSGGPHRTISYTAWNTPVQISPPPNT
jgi:hypothetical protein